ncbi:protein-ADP-ribose hydrolase [Streptomyces sp. NPDC057623]|uniref:protein-ADP-ribose hydrolase n=1 Tax=Streptomyces sp. NPDC057623 TaxID=3346187 RepID=UPI0036A6D37C
MIIDPTSDHSSVLSLDAYRAAVRLDEPFRPVAPAATARDLSGHVRAALGLLRTDKAVSRLGLDNDAIRRIREADSTVARGVLRTLLTVRAPGPMPLSAMAELDALLGGERLSRQDVDARQLPTIAQLHPGTSYSAADRTAVWRGNITTLAIDAIVNAANSALLGCFVPGHPCIDNAIHNAAGPRLRDDCQMIMSAQNAPEPTGVAKITRGYHLPARYVLHTVGPIVGGPVHSRHAEALAMSYRSCLDLAAELGAIRTVAFCGVSTGVFGFPRVPAARVALRTVADWMDDHPELLDRVIFNVFGEDDENAYRTALADVTQPRQAGYRPDRADKW